MPTAAPRLDAPPLTRVVRTNPVSSSCTEPVAFAPLGLANDARRSVNRDNGSALMWLMAPSFMVMPPSRMRLRCAGRSDAVGPETPDGHWITCRSPQEYRKSKQIAWTACILAMGLWAPDVSGRQGSATATLAIRTVPNSSNWRADMRAPSDRARRNVNVDLFATPDGYFASGTSGKVVGHKMLADLVLGQTHCVNDTAIGGGPRAPTQQRRAGLARRGRTAAAAVATVRR